MVTWQTLVSAVNWLGLKARWYSIEYQYLVLNTSVNSGVPNYAN